MSESNVQLLVVVAFFATGTHPELTGLELLAVSAIAYQIVLVALLVSFHHGIVITALLVAPATPASTVILPPEGLVLSYAIVFEVEDAVLAPASLSLTVTRTLKSFCEPKPEASQYVVVVE